MRQQGQITSALVTVLLGACVALLLLVATMRNTTQQWYLQNVADNAAISGATVLSRELNFMSLTNRALLANQVAVAQMVGLASWFAMLEDGSQRLALVTSIIPYVNQFTTQLAQLINRLRPIVMNGVQGIIALLQGITQALSAAQVGMHLAFTSLLLKTIGEVIDRHDPELQWDVVHAPGVVPAPLLWWRKLQHVRTGSKTGQAFATMAAKSRDPFSKYRSYKWFDLAVLRMQKSGGTDLKVTSDGRWNWQALDSTSLHQRLLFFKYELPWARGGRQLRGGQGYSRESKAYGRSGQLNPKGSQQSRRLARTLQGFSSPFSYTDFRDPGATDFPAIIVTVQRPQHERPSRDLMLQGIAKAGVRFSRPAAIFGRLDQAVEQANLFNPLWLTELQPLSLLDKGLLKLKLEATDAGR